MKTLRELSTLTERELSQYAGTGVQQYSRPIIEQRLQQAFDTIFEMDYWPQFLAREQRVLDGATGKVTVPFSLITQWNDVKHVFRRYSDRPIAELPQAFNTLDLTGTQSQFIQPRIDAFLFTMYPLTATDPIEVVGRARPAGVFGINDLLPFDDWALVYYAAWSYLVDDASNPAAVAKYQGLWDMRLKALKDSANKGIVRLNPRSEDIPTRWS